MLGQGGKTARLIDSLVAGHSPALEKEFDGPGRDPDIHPPAGKLIGQTVIMTFNFNVIIVLDPGFFPFGILIGCHR